MDSRESKSSIKQNERWLLFLFTGLIRYADPISFANRNTNRDGDTYSSLRTNRAM